MRNGDVQVDLTTVEKRSIPSSFLYRDVELTILLPPDYKQKPYPVLWLNDGQDIPSVRLQDHLQNLYLTEGFREIAVVGVHANEERLQEYGSSYAADYKDRGKKAGLYGEFLVNELMPYIRSAYSVSRGRTKNVIAGWSMGGLSAIDIAWNYPEQFGKVGVFSGSFWWRSKMYGRGYKDDKHRIIHQLIRNSEKREGLKFWFECGTKDEAADRNKNGLIDSIDDTLDLVRELKAKGYSDKDIEFVIIKGGAHDQDTWSAIMPHFLRWAFL
ncbi:MAG: alpha/beta hydrolase-fold protein [Chitinophagales bacterium]